MLLTGDKINQAGRSVSDTVSGKVSGDACIGVSAIQQDCSPFLLESP